MKKIILPACLTLSFCAYSQAPAATCCSGVSCWIFAAVALILIVSLAGACIYLFFKYKMMKGRNHELKNELSEAKHTIKSLNQSNREANQKIEQFVTEIDEMKKILDDSLINKNVPPPPDDTPEPEEAAAGDVVYYANYKPQDGFFGKFSEENDGYYLWKITMESQTDARYELVVDIDPYRYAERWFDIARIVKCDVPHTGKIISGETVSPGRLFKNELGKWEVDMNNPVEIKFICR